ncbi:MAG: M24 family metallopeptidase, partial [Pseudomonadota bacterium]
VIGAGDDALLCRTKSGRNDIAENDQLTIEWAGVSGNYHAAMMRTLVIGKPRDKHQQLFDAAKTALLAVEDAMRPGNTFGQVFDAQAKALDSAGLSSHRLNACGYNLGARFAPSWMDGPLFYRDNSQPILPGMSLFAHMIIMDSPTNTAMCLGRTYLTTEDAPENLSRHPLEMIVL